LITLIFLSFRHSNFDMSDLNHREVFQEFAEKAEKELGDSLNQLVLYGSVARGEESENSDIDVFAVVQEKKDLELLRNLAFDTGVLENGVSISVQGKLEKDFQGFSESSYLRNIDSDGVRYA